MRRWAAMTALALSAVAGALHAEPASTARQTAGGTTLSVPSGWRAQAQGALLIVQPPEDDVRIGFVDVSAKDADDAVAQGWALFDSGFHRPLRLHQPGALRNGWTERHIYTYEVPPSEKGEAQAFAWRAAERWCVVLLEGSSATLDKRSGPLAILLNSARPAGYQRESFAGRTPHPLDAQRIAALRSFVADGMRRLQVPGVGLSLIDGGDIVYQGGIGVRRLGRPEPVDADSLFIAASNTKALTTLLLARLVDAGKLRWDQPVVEVFPSFKLGDADTTRRVQIRHLVCACTGLPRQDLEWSFEFSHVSAAQILGTLAQMQPTSGFGEVFQYSNLMAAAAGYVGGAVALPGRELGAAYDEAMRSEVLGPLGMSRSSFDFARAMRGDYAWPHDVDLAGRAVAGVMDQNLSVVPARPAGGLWTSAHELSQYVRMELARGKLPDGRQLVSVQNLLERYKPNVPVSEDVEYGMGLMVDTRWGITVVHHGGDLPGYHSDMLWLPDYGIGAVFLSNGENGWALRGPTMRKLIELLFDGRPEADAQLDATAKQLDAARIELRDSLRVPADAAAARRLAPRYRNALLGELRVQHHGKALVFLTGELRSEYGTRRNADGSLSFISISPTMQGYEYVAGEAGGKRTLTIRDAQHEYVYTEQ